MSANVEAWTLLSIGLAFISTRVYVRWSLVGPASFQADDYLMPLAGLLFTAETVAAYLVGALYSGLTNSYMTDAERAALSSSSREYYDRQMGSKIQVIGWSLYAAILWLVKFSLVVFYARLTTGLKYMAIRIKVAYGLLAATYIATECFILFGCQPITKYWQINPDPGNFCQPTRSELYVLPLVIFNVLTDFFLLSIPLPMLWTVNIGMKKKISLMGLFSGAIFVIMASIIRAVVILTAGPQGAVSGSQWACRETFVSLVVSNLPIIQPLLRRLADRVGLSVLFSTTNKTSQKYKLSSRGGLNDTRTGGLRSKRTHHPLTSATKTTAWGSDEHILVQGGIAGGVQVHKEVTVVHETTVGADDWPKNAPATTTVGGAVQPGWATPSPESSTHKKYQYSRSGSPQH